jgi:hypothetical protein
MAFILFVLTFFFFSIHSFAPEPQLYACIRLLTLCCCCVCGTGLDPAACMALGYWRSIDRSRRPAGAAKQLFSRD